MKLLKGSLVLLLCLFFSSFLVKPLKNKEVFKAIDENVKQYSEAYKKFGEATSTIGHRLTGTANGKKAEEYIYQQLKNYGFSPNYEPFEVNAWSRSNVSLSLVPAESDNFRDIEVVALAHSPVSAHLTAQIVDCGDGLPEDFESLKTDLKGKVALFNINIQDKNNQGKENLHRSEKTALAIANGASGVIIANAVKGGVLLTGTASVTGELIPIPAVCVSVESGKAIRKWIKDEKNILAVIDMQNFSRPVRARNISAVFKGSSKKLKNEKIIIGAHLDSWDLAQGAVDNGIGTFTVLDIARVFKTLDLKTKRTIEFNFYMGEEQGLLGSNFKAEEIAKNKEKVSLMMNLDMVNNAMGFNAFGHNQLLAYFEKTGRNIAEISPNFKNLNNNKAGLHSDHVPFMLKGIPVCSPSGNLPIKSLNCYHANCDKFDLISKQDLENNIRYTAMMLYALANEDELPVQYMNETKTKEYLSQQGLKEALILGKNWPWQE